MDFGDSIGEKDNICECLFKAGQRVRREFVLKTNSPSKLEIMETGIKLYRRESSERQKQSSRKMGQE